MIREPSAISWEVYDSAYKDFTKEVVVYNPPHGLEEFIIGFINENFLSPGSYETVSIRNELIVYVHYTWLATDVIGAILEYEHVL